MILCDRDLVRIRRELILVKYLKGRRGILLSEVQLSKVIVRLGARMATGRIRKGINQEYQSPVLFRFTPHYSISWSFSIHLFFQLLD